MSSNVLRQLLCWVFLQWNIVNGFKLINNGPAFNKQLLVIAKPFQKILTGLAISSSLFISSPILPVPNVYAGAGTALTTAESQVIDLFERNRPSVVYINTFVERVDIFSNNVMELPAGTGSGFVWDAQGPICHIVTNYHVIRNAQSAKVVVSDAQGRPIKAFKAFVVGVDPDKDIAVLLVDSRNTVPWRPILPGNSKDLKVGQFTMAIGNPFGLDHTLTTGVISGLGREVRSPTNKPINNVIQTGTKRMKSMKSIYRQ